MNFVVPADHREKIKESRKKDKYLNLARELTKTVENGGDGDTNCNWCAWNCPPKELENGQEEIKIGR